MSAPRFLTSQSLDDSTTVGTTIQLADSESHHAARVLRLKHGDQIEILSTTTQRAFVGRLVDFSNSSLSASITDALPRPNLAPVTLLVALLKPARSELICEKVTEMGVRAVHFFIAEHGRYSKNDGPSDKHLDRLLRIRNTALKQSRSTVVTSIQLHPSFAAALNSAHPEGSFHQPKLLCTPTSTDPGDKPSDFITIFRDQFFSIPPLENSLANVESYIAVGPEGGFSSTELDIAFKSGYRAANLGPTILRSETAALLACGIALLVSAGATEPTRTA